MSARVTADPALCISSGSCESVAPDLFEVGDEGVVVLRPDVPEDRLAAARDAARSCPTRALHVGEP